MKINDSFQIPGVYLDLFVMTPVCMRQKAAGNLSVIETCFQRWNIKINEDKI
jgi:myo-inositol-1-phosphate synthase